MASEKAIRMAFSLSSRSLNQATKPRQVARARAGRADGSMVLNIRAARGVQPTTLARVSSSAMMRTIALDGGAPEQTAIDEAAAILRRGGLVAFPTETVYGLGANALDASAVARIFAAKGRPSYNPLIVHVPNEAAARALASEWPEAASRLAHVFWPGPLTIVVRKQAVVPDI